MDDDSSLVRDWFIVLRLSLRPGDPAWWLVSKQERGCNLARDIFMIVGDCEANAGIAVGMAVGIAHELVCVAEEAGHDGRRIDWGADARGVREAADAAAERIDAAGRRYSFSALRHRLIRSPAVLRRLAATPR